MKKIINRVFLSSISPNKLLMDTGWFQDGMQLFPLGIVFFLLSHVRILFPQLIDTDYKDPHAVVNIVKDDARANLVRLVFEKTARFSPHISKTDYSISLYRR